MTKVSVVMPVYNTDETYLREAVESILNQTFTDFEFLIIDDGSTNNAKDVIFSYPDKRIKYVKNERNMGLIKTLNKGFGLASGEYIARMDSDDISLPVRFEKQVKFLDENPNVGVLGTWFQYFPSNRIVETFTYSKDIKECLLVNSNNIGHPTVMIRNSVIKEINAKYDENALYVEDYALWLALIDKVDFANIPEILLKYRVHRKGICGANKIAQGLSCAKIMYAAQGKYFNIDAQSIINTIEKLQNNQKINSSELLEINQFSDKVKLEMQKQGFDCDYGINRDFYKTAIKMCKKDILFYALLWAGHFNKSMKLRLGFKLINSFRFTFAKQMPQVTPCGDNPKVSVVMALYNTPYCQLKRTVKSILKQTFGDFELIVIDDASTNPYESFFKSINDSRIKYYRLEKNSGPGHARNEGIKKALGKYIAIADSDDVYLPKRLELQVAFLDKNPETSLISSNFKFSNKHKIPSILTTDEDIKIALLFNSALASSTVMFKKDVFTENNLYYPEDTNFGEDYQLWVEAMFKGIKMANLPDVLMIYTRSKNQLSKKTIKIQADALKETYKIIFKNLNIEVSQQDLDLHYDIYRRYYNGDPQAEVIESWFDKIIETNKNLNIFNEAKLIQKKSNVLENFIESKQRLFKIKIGNYDLCLYEKMKMVFTDRE